MNTISAIMTKQTGKKNDFQSLLKSLHDAHDKEVKTQRKEIDKLGEELHNLKKVKTFTSPLMADIEGILERGRVARDRMKAFLATGKGRPNHNDWEAFIRMCEVEHHDFIFSMLASGKGLLSGRDLFVCMLVCDGWKEYNTQVLLNISSERISNIFRKINNAVFDMDTSKNLEHNILAFRPDKREFNFPTWIPLGS